MKAEDRREGMPPGVDAGREWVGGGGDKLLKSGEFLGASGVLSVYSIHCSLMRGWIADPSATGKIHPGGVGVARGYRAYVGTYYP